MYATSVLRQAMDDQSDTIARITKSMNNMVDDMRETVGHYEVMMDMQETLEAEFNRN